MVQGRVTLRSLRVTHSAPHHPRMDDRDPRYDEDAQIQREINALREADNRRRTEQPSSEEYHDAVGDVERQARRIIRGVSDQEGRVEAEVAEDEAARRAGRGRRTRTSSG